MRYDVYDFDNTIYRGDTLADFYLYCLARFPYIAVLWPWQILMGVLYFLRLIPKWRAKQAIFRYYLLIPDIERQAERFWRRNMAKIKPFYRGKPDRSRDIIVSASCSFLIAPACLALGVHRIIATEVSPRTGKFLSPNCWGEEKVKRLRAELPDAEIGLFYSDSHSDAPLARLAAESFLVTGERIAPFFAGE